MYTARANIQHEATQVEICLLGQNIIVADVMIIVLEYLRHRGEHQLTSAPAKPMRHGRHSITTTGRSLPTG
eukprot:scaffold1237_cov403-Prasinococcus_capsulatus_cf.AAC.3